MMEITLTTPAVFFPAISLLMLAYTNRFLHLAALIRTLHGDFLKERNPDILPQVENLKLRLKLIRWMQALGVLSMLGCTISIIFIFFRWQYAGETVFGASVVMMAASLICSLREITLSGGALSVLLEDFRKKDGSRAGG